MTLALRRALEDVATERYVRDEATADRARRPRRRSAAVEKAYPDAGHGMGSLLGYEALTVAPAFGSMEGVTPASNWAALGKL